MRKIWIRGRLRDVSCDWAAAALLRDNVMHFVEGGVPSGRFPAIHALADAPSFPDRPLPPAADVADELAIVLPQLRRTRGSDLAIGLWTRAVMKRQRQLPSVRGTVSAREVGWEVPMKVPADATLEDVYRPFLHALRHASGRAAQA